MSFAFTGKEDDLEAGIQYFGKRYLIPALGVWASPDPLAVHSPGSADLNLYAYVRGRLLAATDPTGLVDQKADGATGASQGGDTTQQTAKQAVEGNAPPAAPDGTQPTNDCNCSDEGKTYSGEFAKGAAKTMTGLAHEAARPAIAQLRRADVVISAAARGDAKGTVYAGADFVAGNLTVMPQALANAAMGTVDLAARVVAPGDTKNLAGIAGEVVTGALVTKALSPEGQLLAREIIADQRGSIGNVGRPGARTPSEAGISSADALRIQNAADRTHQTISVVGSRAAGTSTILSDWDYVMSGKSSQRHSAASSVPRGTYTSGVVSGTDIWQSYNPKAPGYVPGPDPTRPFVMFSPKK